MEFRLDGNEQEETQQEKPDAAASDGYYHVPNKDMAMEKPAVTTISESTRQVHVPKFVIFIIAAAVIALILTLVPWNKKTALDSYLRMSQTELEQTLGVTFQENAAAVKYLSIPNGDTTGFQVYSTADEGLNVIYYNGRQQGISFTGRKYSVFGIKVGDSISHLLLSNGDEQIISGEDSAGYRYSQYFNMLEDLQKSGSTSEYFIGVDGSALILVVNDTSHRVVNIIYYYDTQRLLQGIS